MNNKRRITKEESYIRNEKILADYDQLVMNLTNNSTLSARAIRREAVATIADKYGISEYTVGSYISNRRFRRGQGAKEVQRMVLGK